QKAVRPAGTFASDQRLDAGRDAVVPATVQLQSRDAYAERTVLRVAAGGDVRGRFPERLQLPSQHRGHAEADPRSQLVPEDQGQQDGKGAGNLGTERLFLFGLIAPRWLRQA